VFFPVAGFANPEGRASSTPTGHLTFAFLAALLANPLYLAGLKNSFLLAVATTALATARRAAAAFGL